MSRAVSRSSSRDDWSLDDVQHLVLDGVSWELYEHLLKEVGDRPLRMTYDNGELEIMSPLPEHEYPKKLLARLVEMLSFDRDIPMLGLGSTTFRRKDKSKGLEPDECYFFKTEERMRGKKRWNPKRDPAPELVIEVDITSRSVAREPIYAALGVPEIWRYDGSKVQCLVLDGKEYVERSRSLVFPFLRPADLKRFLDMVPNKEQNAIVRAFLHWSRKLS